MFTAFGNQFWSFSASEPIAALPLQIFTYAITPYDDWHRQAWAGALMLVILIVGTTTLVRLVFMRRILGGAR
jgi:phosphate transport system permease protein